MKNIIKYSGIIFIILFSALSVNFSLYYKTYTEEWKSYTRYSQFLEDQFYDYRMMQTIDKTKENPKIILADIDTQSIKVINRWPFPRNTWGEMLFKLKDFGAKTVAFDVFFAEEAITCNGKNPDDRFVEGINYFQEGGANTVILPYNLNVAGTEYFSELPDDLYFNIINTKRTGNISPLLPTAISKSTYPYSKLLETEAGLGFIETNSDMDGVIRNYQAVAKVQGFDSNRSAESLETADSINVISLGLAAYMYWNNEFNDELGDPSKRTILDLTTDGGFPALISKDSRLEITNLGETKIRWFGGSDKYTRVPIHKILSTSSDDKELKEIFKDSLVYVGSTAFGAYDLRNTPVDSMLPGVFAHMNFTQMLIDDYKYKPFETSAKYSWILLIVSILILILVQIKENPIIDIAVFIALISSLYYIDTYYLTPQGYEIRLFWCFFALVMCYSWNTIVNFYMANQDKAFLFSAFGNYISPELIDEMYESGHAPTLGGTSGIRTAYFTDIQGFSSFSEKLSATQLVELLNEYLTAMTDILLEEKGTLDKYEGDAIIAFFGAPMELPDHAQRSCMVAHRMQEKLLELRKKWVSEGDKWPKIVHDMRMRIGINSGDIVTGNMGSASRMNYTMMGDSVNLAARLEESAKQYGIFTQVAKETVEMAGDKFLWRELDTIKVVGKSIPVTTYDLLGLKETAPDYLKELSEKFSAAILLYKAQKWDEAIELFKVTLELEYMRFPDLKGLKTNPSEIYIKRCEDYKKLPPPPEWDGVFTLTSK
ncbi:CHASE2 domain-containing protein [Halobacteriovorax sp.]|uniref:CHASE2 domain-containing protein n=1 Tax=Halobacteriovorax sp. TaxID=2020862 RepID=UPI003AF20119